MNIREHCISSVFVHLIVALLLATVSQFHPKMPLALTVSLYEDVSGQTTAASRTKIGALIETAKPAKAAEKSAVETEPAADKRVSGEVDPPSALEPATEPETSPTATADMAIQGQEMTRLAQIHHAFALRASAFADIASQSIRKALHKGIETDYSEGGSDGTAEVMLYFNDEGGLTEIWGATNSEKLHSLLDRVDWKSVPRPGDYMLKLKGLHVKIKIERGEPSLLLTAL